MSVFNGARFLRPAVDSILSQTLDDFEFIVVDDGSTDETARILEEYEDPRIILQRNEKNLGLAQSLNRGVSLAQADLIARQDSDDISHPERLNALVSFLDRNPETGVVGSAVQWIDEESRSDKVWPQGLDNQEIQQLLLRTCPLIHGSTAYRNYVSTMLVVTTPGWSRARITTFGCAYQRYGTWSVCLRSFTGTGNMRAWLLSNMRPNNRSLRVPAFSML